jgi:hypothetical protein
MVATAATFGLRAETGGTFGAQSECGCSGYHQKKPTAVNPASQEIDHAGHLKR